jgi:putative NADPH-quinone reductase
LTPIAGKAGYEGAKPLEPVLEEALANLEWCSHFVLAFPLWWGGFPAKLKGWIDRVLLPGRTFTTEETTPIGLPAPLLKGRTARVLITSDTPRSFMWLAYGDAIMRQLRGQILGFVGFKPVRITFFAPASDPKPGSRRQAACPDGATRPRGSVALASGRHPAAGRRLLPSANRCSSAGSASSVTCWPRSSARVPGSLAITLSPPVSK